MVATDDGGDPGPRIVGRYALFDEIAAGGMATIHLGRFVGPVGFSRTVAIKTLHPQFAKDPEFVEMFLEEARLASRIQHPNVISTVDIATTEGEVFLVMEYVAGESLAKLVRASLKGGEHVPVDVAGSVLAGMLHGLHATHEAKNEQLEPMHIVHRDVSPQNVLVGLDGIARVFDFGVAKAAAMRSQATTDGQMKGKLSYMSPEQLNAKEIDRRTDVFAAGVVAWECLTGRRLFAGSDPGEVLAKVLTLEIPSPRSVADRVPEPVSAAVMRALERNADERWQTAREFAIEIERTMPPAAAHVVGEWVERHASSALDDRRSRVERVERASLSLNPTDASLASITPAPPGVSSLPSASHGGSDPTEGSGSGTSRTSNLTVSQPSVTPSGSGRSVLLPLFLGALAAAFSAAIWYWQQGGFEDATLASSPASLPAPPGDPRAADVPPPSSGPESKPPGEPGEQPPVLQIDSLPERRDAPDAGAKPAAAKPPQAAEAKPPQAATAKPPRGAPSHAPPRRGRRRARARAPRPVAAKPAPRAAARPQPPPPSAAEKTVEKKDVQPPSECQPPWFFDDKGIQRVKPQCI